MDRVERALPGDFLQIAALDRIAWPSRPDTYIPDGEHIWRVWVEYATMLVARREGGRHSEPGQDIVGALVMFPTQRSELFLHKIMVHPSCRGCGVGTALMQAALQLASAPVLLTVDPANTAAVKLYEKLGFRVRERIDGFYRPHEDRYVMEFTARRAADRSD